MSILGVFLAKVVNFLKVDISVFRCDISKKNVSSRREK